MTEHFTAGAEDCHWTVDGLRLAGLAWGPKDGIPVLALHGWLDHAGSFQVLAPRLAGCRVVALDLSGQGLSDHRAAHATYNIWDDLPQIAEVLEQLGWRDCVLMGHSRGAIIATLFAAAQHARVRAVVALDALLPEPVADTAFVPTLRAFMEQTRMQKSRAARVFASPAEYIERRQRQGDSPVTARALADRALEQVPEGSRLRADPRLFASSAVKLTRPQVKAALRAIHCPMLTLWARGGLKVSRPGVSEMAALGERLIEGGEARDLPGDHHLHLDPATAGPVAEAVLDFLQRRLGVQEESG